MIDKAGGGDFVVIRATGSDGYNQYVPEMGGVDSVESLVIPSLEAANDPFVVDRVRKAEASSRGVTRATTSSSGRAPRSTTRSGIWSAATCRSAGPAGLAVLGQFDFAASAAAVLL